MKTFIAMLVMLLTFACTVSAQGTAFSYRGKLDVNGFQALYANTSGSNNIALGYYAGYNITTGSSNIDIGNAGLSTDTNIIRIGTTQTVTYLAGTAMPTASR